MTILFLFRIKVPRHFIKMGLKHFFESDFFKGNQNYEKNNAEHYLACTEHPLEFLNVQSVFLADEVIKDLVKKVLGERVYHSEDNKLSLLYCAKLLFYCHITNNSKHYHVHEMSYEIEDQS